MPIGHFLNRNRDNAAALRSPVAYAGYHVMDYARVDRHFEDASFGGSKLASGAAAGGYVLTADGSGGTYWAAGGGGGVFAYTAGQNSLYGTLNAGTLPSGYYAAQIGYNAYANGNYAVAIGNESYAGTQNSIAIGRRANVSDTNSIGLTIGTATYGIGQTYVRGYSAVAIGEAVKITASADRSIVIGRRAYANGAECVVIGGQADGFGYSGVAIGYAASVGVSSSHAIAIGFSTGANSQRSVAIGYGANSSYDNTVSIGQGVQATSGNQFNIGVSNTNKLTFDTWTAAASAKSVTNHLPILIGGSRFYILLST